MIAERLPGILNLSPSEKWLLASELWDEVSGDPAALPQSEAQRRLIRQRWECYMANPDNGSTWDEIKKRLGKG